MTAKRSTKPVSGRAKPGNRYVAGQDATALVDGLDSVELAKKTLHAICRDVNAPSSARAQAARTLLELSGALRVGAVMRDAPASELTPEELDARLARLGDVEPV